MRTTPANLFALLACALALAGLFTGCNGGGGSTRYTYVKTHLPLHDGAEMVAVAPGDGTVQVAVCRDGEMFGCEAVDEEMRETALLPMGRPVDHPQLAEWRRQLAVIEELAKNPDTDATALVRELAPFPFEGARGHRLVVWMQDDPARAGEALDALGDMRIDKHSAATLVRCALTGSALTDARLAGWIANPGIGGRPESAELLIDAPEAGPTTWRAAFTALGHAFGSDRSKIYELAAARLAGRADDADLMVAAIEKLYGNDRRKVALALLERADTSPAYARACLDQIELFYGSDRYTIYVAAAGLTAEDPECAPLLVKRVEELYGSDRRKAALEVIGWEKTPAAVSAGFAGTIEVFHGTDRARVLRAVIASPAFTGPGQEACLEAAKHLYGTDRRKVLGEIATSPRATRPVRDKAINQLANN